MADTYELAQLTEKLEKALLESYGPVLSSCDLWKILSYKTIHAYRQARHRKTLPVAEFKMKGRRGYFALTTDIAKYLAEQRFLGETSLKEEEPHANN